MRLGKLWIAAAVLAGGSLGNKLYATPKLADVFQSGMVLQREMKANVWGTASAGEEVTVTFRDQSAKAKADPDGKWTVSVPTGHAGGPFTLKAAGQGSVTLQDVLVGEVWIASGQSNMAFTLTALLDPEKVISEANDPQLRFFTVETETSDTPKTTVKGAWEPTTPQTAGMFSAVAYYFAKNLRAELKVPVGILFTSWGGTGVTSWISKEGMAPLKVAAAVNARWQKVLEEFPERQKKYESDVAAWDSARVAAEKAGTPFTAKKPAQPPGPGFRNVPHGLFNAMLNPLIPYTVRGIIWYQGEGNTPYADEYEELFGGMIVDWRKRFGQGDIPFLFVQLAGFTSDDKRDWPTLRQAQANTLRLPNTGMAIAFDVGEKDNIHPKNKKAVGDRLAAVAFNKFYNMPRPDSGPQMKSAKVDGASIVVTLDPVYGELTAQRPSDLTGFVIAGSDEKFQPAHAVLEGNTVRVSSPDVPHPIAVRYLWANWAEASIFNSKGFPMPPFHFGDEAKK